MRGKYIIFPKFNDFLKEKLLTLFILQQKLLTLDEIDNLTSLHF